MTNKPKICVVGGGMITQVQILPSLYHLQRLNIIGDIDICALNAEPLQRLTQDTQLQKAFPGHTFTPHPSFDTPGNHPDMYKQTIASLPKHSIVVVAMPDQLHNEVINVALDHDQHVCSVKPLVLKHAQAKAIEQKAHDKGLVVGVEYHKRFDDRALMARREYRAGRFGEFKIGHAEMNEPYYYRHSNFMNWCTCENSDMFTYVGCHYVDQLHFITGLLPHSVSVYGIKDKYPNGNEGYLWTDARVIWENGACLHVTDVMGYPDQGPGGNFQGIRMYCAGSDKAAMLVHNDQFRGIEYCYLEAGTDPGDTIYSQPSPDYFKYIDLGGNQLTPVGYGYRSIEYIIKQCCRAIEIGPDLAQRQKLLNQLDEEAIMATPKNSAYNELVMEAGRLSITNDGHEAIIDHKTGTVKLK
ncbi:MAG: Gfo/Idh/MocA family oxidoreductase [Sedimentisphaerales bacterium]|nr:Gfo/Idh/MocA family oxidoreductase [Sedimentisphaerales bacterium]